MRTARLVIILAAALACMAGCKKPPEPYTGPLTGERIMGAQDMVHPFDDWDEAMAKLQAQLGKPTGQKDKYVQWAVVEGDDCYFYQLDSMEKNGKKQVGAVYHPMKVEKQPNVIGSQEECLEAAGKLKAKPVEDPNAPAPPTDGSAVTVAQLRAGVDGGKSKWVGKHVKLSGLYLGTSTATSGDTTTVSISISGVQGSMDTTVACELADPKAPLLPLKQWDAIVVEGTVGTAFGGSLTECSVSK